MTGHDAERTVPTRGQIAEAVAKAGVLYRRGCTNYGLTYESFVADRVLALFPQPTPPAEPKPETCPHCRHAAHADWCPNMASDNDCLCTHDSNETAEPPRIEDLTPGTTFTADYHRVTRRVRVLESGSVWLRGIDDESPSVRVEDIDPSTIRDVTPPAGA